MRLVRVGNTLSQRFTLAVQNGYHSLAAHSNVAARAQHWRMWPKRRAAAVGRPPLFRV